MPGISGYHGNGRGYELRTRRRGAILLKLIFVTFVVLLSLCYGRRHRLLSFPLLLLIAALFFSRVYWRKVFGLTIHFEQLASGLLFLAFLYDLLRKKIRLRFAPLTILVLCLLPLMILSSLLESKLPLQSLKKTLVYVPYVLAFLALVHYWADKERLRGAWDFFYFSGTLALAISLAGFVLLLCGVNLGMVKVQFASLWLRGTMVVPNILGSTAVIILIVSFIRLIFQKKFGSEAWRQIAALIIATACVMLSFTRAAWAGAVLGLVAVLLLSFKRVSIKPVLLSLALVIGTAGLTYLATARIKLPELATRYGLSNGEYGEETLDQLWSQNSAKGVAYKEKIQSLFREGMYSISIRDRLRTYGNALQDWLSSPILGRGTESFISENKNRSEYYIPSTWIAILHDWGLIGLLLHGIFLFLVLAGLWKIYRKTQDPFLGPYSLTLMVILFVSTMMYQTATTMQLSIFWVLLAFYASAVAIFSHSAAAGHRISEEGRADKSPHSGIPAPKSIGRGDLR